MSEISMCVEEVEEIKRTLDALTQTISDSGQDGFTKYFNNLFYEDGRAIELLQRVLSSELYKMLNQTKGFEEMGVFDVALQDYSGKVQMLITYYNFLLEYVRDAMIKFQEQDAAIKNMISSWDQENTGVQ